MLIFLRTFTSYDRINLIGLMISALSRAAQVLDDGKYLERAQRAASFVRDSLYKKESLALLRNAYRDEKG